MDHRPVNVLACALLAALSVFDYPARQAGHSAAKRDFLAAMRRGDSAAMEAAARKGAGLLPDDPVWAYNLACALARCGRKDEAFDALDRAVSLGFRDADAIAADEDLRPLAGERRFKEAVDEARRTKDNPILTGPLSARPASGAAGGAVMAGEHNLAWDLDAGCFNLLLKLDGLDAKTSAPSNLGDVYFNRDGGHSMPDPADFPGLTRLMFDREAREKRVDLDIPNMAVPYPVFGNCSRAQTKGPLWRSLPRAMTTLSAGVLPLMQRFYLSNQIWVFPAVFDCPPAGTNGDVFASVAPYWIATQGKSWSDQYYLKAALEISRSLPPDAKREAVRRGMLAPLVQTIVRKSLAGVSSEADYLTEKAHPTAFPPLGLDMERLKKLARAVGPDSIPPIAAIKGVAIGKPAAGKPGTPELVYATTCAWSFVLRAPDAKREFVIAAGGGDEYAFAAVHDPGGAAKIEMLSANTAKVTLDRGRMSVNNRVDVGIFAKRGGSGWGPPSFACFAVAEPAAEGGYTDPFLAVEKAEEKAEGAAK